MKRKAFKFRVPAPLACSFDFPVEGVTNSAWHCLAVEGKWAGHWQGAFSIDEPMMRQMVEKNVSAKLATPVDYEHASVFGDHAPATGWIEPGNLQVRKADDGQHQLWGKVDWTPNAADQIRAREYRYLSPTIVFNTRDRKSGDLTGASLHSVALTNKPFLEELPEVRLNSVRENLVFEEERVMNEEQLKLMAKALGLPETATADEVTAASQRAGAALADRSIALQALGLQADASGDAIKAAVLKLQKPVEGVDPKEFEAVQHKLAERDAADKVAAAMSEGKVTAKGTKLHAWASKAALETPAMFDEWVKSAPKQVSTEVKLPASNRPASPLDAKKPEEITEDDLTDDEAKACRDSGMSPSDFAKYNLKADENVARRMKVRVSELHHLREQGKADGL